VEIASITPSQVQAMVKSLSETMSPGSVRGIHSVLASIFRTAIRDRVVANSPVTPDIRLPEVAQRRVEPLTLEQVETLADAVGPLYRPLVVLGAGAGLRVGEALGMPVGGIDFPRRQLSVTQQAVTVRRVTTIAVPKTKTSVRTIPLADAVLTELAGCLEGRDAAPADLLVAGKDGVPIPQNRFSQTWSRAVRRAGLPPGTRFHDLRHTYASALIASGCSVKVVRSGAPGPQERGDDARHLQPPVAARRRPSSRRRPDFLRWRSVIGVSRRGDRLIEVQVRASSDVVVEHELSGARRLPARSAKSAAWAGLFGLSLAGIILHCLTLSCVTFVSRHSPLATVRQHGHCRRHQKTARFFGEGSSPRPGRRSRRAGVRARRRRRLGGGACRVCDRRSMKRACFLRRLCRAASPAAPSP